MSAIVVYESHWGNTAAIARAIAEGIGADARALSTGEAVGDLVSGADLIVAGAPLLGFRLPTDAMAKGLNAGQGGGKQPDTSQPTMRSWLSGLPRGTAPVAAFETRIWWSPGSAAKSILSSLQQSGYRPIAKPQKFLVKAARGPLKDGELERAKAWGAELARAAKQ